MTFGFDSATQVVVDALDRLANHCRKPQASYGSGSDGAPRWVDCSLWRDWRRS
jgi:hypothetical protein